MLSAAEAVRAIDKGQLSCVSLVEACLARIEARESDVHAWAQVDSGRALDRARELDRKGASGPMRGIPVGIKDVIDTADLPTQYGSVIYRGNKANWDAACVTSLKNAGAVILGKTETTEFALRHPARTRNPHNLAHTPGGSSSGSAAAVADFMVPLALGTQTTGSTIRPGSFCGVFAFKPTFGTINRAGLKLISESQDTIGVLARSLEDIVLVMNNIGACVSLVTALEPGSAPRIAFCRTPHWNQANQTTRTALENAASRLATAGAKVTEFALPADFDNLAASQEIVVNFEMRRALAFERLNYPDRLSQTLKTRLTKSESIDCNTYHASQRHLTRCRQIMTDMFRDFDAVMAPSAPGEAPRGLRSTGVPTFQTVWQALHCPCVNVPVLTGPSGLPLGVQIISDKHKDERALYCGEWVRRALEA